MSGELAYLWDRWHGTISLGGVDVPCEFRRLKNAPHAKVYAYLDRRPQALDDPEQFFAEVSREFGDLSVRARNALVRAGLHTRQAVAVTPDSSLRMLPNFGPGILAEIRVAIPAQENGQPG
jgi:hypothetical protein